MGFTGERRLLIRLFAILRGQFLTRRQCALSFPTHDRMGNVLECVKYPR